MVNRLLVNLRFPTTNGHTHSGLRVWVRAEGNIPGAARSTHAALRDVVRTYPSASYIIEGDIKFFYDDISHVKLMTYIQERIADGKILGLFRKFLNAGYLEEWTFHRTFSGVHQGTLFSRTHAGQPKEHETKAGRLESR